LNFQDLPTVEVLTRHLGGRMCYTSPEDGCLRMGFVSPFGSTVAIAGVAMMAGAWFMMIEKGHEEAIRVDRVHAEIERAQRRNRKLQEERRRMNDRVRQLEKQLEELRKIIEDKERK
ncbi:MAG: hypothetical protein ACYTGN_06080, partial [Planctomycetota bacterium]